MFCQSTNKGCKHHGSASRSIQVAAESCPGSSCSNFSREIFVFGNKLQSQKLRFSKQTHLEDGFAFDPDVVTAESFRKEPAGLDGIAKSSLVSLGSIDFKGPF
jgi:hypothetical protein